MTLARNSRASGSSMEMRVAVRGRGHARHHDLAVGVVLVFELLDRALPAGAHRAHRRVPAEVGQVEPEREAGVQQVLRGVDADASWPSMWIVAALMRPFSHGQRRSRMWRWKSSRKYLSALCSGSTAPGASAQKV